MKFCLNSKSITIEPPQGDSKSSVVTTILSIKTTTHKIILRDG